MKRKPLILMAICMAVLFIVIVSVVMASKGMKQTDGETQSAAEHAELQPETESEDLGQGGDTDSVSEFAPDGKQDEETVLATSLENETVKLDNSVTHAESSLKAAESPSTTMSGTSEQKPGSEQRETPPVPPAEPVPSPTEQTTVPTDSMPDPTEPGSDPTVVEEPTIQNVSAAMEKHSSQGLGYWLYTPENPSGNMPLIVYLHGGSGKGENLDQLLNIDGFPKWLYDGSLGTPSAYILIPQLPSSQKGWSDVGSSVIALIDELASEYGLDTNNISLTGHSMGGTGTFALAKAYPDTFNKIAPCSGSIRVTDEDLVGFQNIDVWAFVGSADTIVEPKSSIYFVDKLSQFGNAKLTQFEGATHFDVPALVYLNSEINIIDWLIAD